MEPPMIQIIFQILLSMILGMAIGVEREHRKKSAGLRTYTLVSLGATILTILSINGFQNFLSISSYDPSRIASQIVVGIGFIGAGLIFLKDNKVQGLTTAAGIWVTSAIGMAVGLKFYFLAVFSTATVLSVLWLLRTIEARIPKSDANVDQDNHHASLS